MGWCIPWVKRNGGKSTFFILLISIGIAYLQGVGTVKSYAESAISSIKNGGNSGLHETYLVGDFIPALQWVGGTVTPAMWEEVRRISHEGAPCPQAMAKQLLGEAADVNAACGSAQAKSGSQ